MTRARQDFIQTGRTVKTPYLIQQFNVIHEAAAEDARDLRAFGVTAEMLAGINANVRTINELSADRALVAAESKGLTETQTSAFDDAKAWLKRNEVIAKNAFEGEVGGLEGFLAHAKIGRSVPRLLAALDTNVRLADEHADKMEPFGGGLKHAKAGQRAPIAPMRAAARAERP